MENANEIHEESIDWKSAEVGEDIPQVEAKTVLVEKIETEEVETKNGKSTKLKLMVRHPDLPDKLIEISSVKYQNVDKLKEGGLWLKKDKEGKIPFKSGVGCMMRFFKKTPLGSIEGDQLPTIVMGNGYLAIKAY